MIKTLSIPSYLEEFLKENPDLSPSKMLQSKIIEIREQRRLNSIEMHAYERRANRLQEELLKTANEVDKLNEKIRSLEEKNV